MKHFLPHLTLSPLVRLWLVAQPQAAIAAGAGLTLLPKLEPLRTKRSSGFQALIIGFLGILATVL